MFCISCRKPMQWRPTLAGWSCAPCGVLQYPFNNTEQLPVVTVRRSSAVFTIGVAVQSQNPMDKSDRT